MKKRILIINVLILAVFAGVSTTYAQLAPRAVTCLSNDALHPVPGQEYTYEVTVPNPANGDAWTALRYTWFVTQNQKFIEIDSNGQPVLNYTEALGAEAANDGEYMDVDANDVTAGVYANPDNTQASITITWQNYVYDPTQPLFVVVNVDGDNGICSAINNIKVYRIDPLFAFTLDIDNLNQDGTNHTSDVYGDEIEDCISVVQSAYYDQANGCVVYDYGADTLFYEVIAANWYDKWQLSVQLSGLNSVEGQTAEIDWTYAPTDRTGLDLYNNATTWYEVGSSIAADGSWTSSTLVESQNTTTGAVSSDGESIFVRLVVIHGAASEGIDDQTITLAVDGVLAHDDGSGTYVPAASNAEGDIHYTDDGSGTCPWFDGFTNDYAIATLKARPNIQSATPNSDASGTLDFLDNCATPAP